MSAKNELGLTVCGAKYGVQSIEAKVGTSYIIIV